MGHPGNHQASKLQRKLHAFGQVLEERICAQNIPVRIDLYLDQSTVVVIISYFQPP
jgi:hypothetical protein